MPEKFKKSQKKTEKVKKILKKSEKDLLKIFRNLRKKSGKSEL